MKTKVAYITTARSDYGPSYWVIHDLFADKHVDMTLVVSGSHLSAAHGNTYREIEADHWPNVLRVPFLGRGQGTSAIGRGAGRALAEFTSLFNRLKPDIAVLCGDRHELLPIATAALITGTPIAHLWGGDITEGAFDDQVRHALTKLSHLHFPSTKAAAARLRQMGEESWRVHAVGDSALDHFVRGSCAGREELAEFLGFVPDRNTLLVTFHPATLETESVPQQARELAAALKVYKGQLVVTAPAPDPGGAAIRRELIGVTRKRPGAVFVESLGSFRYRGLLALVGAVVGNSSSGLIEAASVPVPVVNIGNRQRGRERTSNVLDVPATRSAIHKAITRTCEASFRDSLSGLQNPYGDGRSAKRIISVLAKMPSRTMLLSKQFVNYP